MLFALYGTLIFIATVLGAFVGLGGGVIIKPVLDIIGAHTLQEISFFSSCAVFVMSLTSTAKHIKNRTSIDKKTVLLFSLGSIPGGFLGNRLFDTVLAISNTQDTVKGVQSVLMGLLLIFVIVSVNVKIKRYELKKHVAVIMTGLILGFVAAFLGIGGGPINVAVLTLLFSFTMRDAAVYSVAVIFFSQLTNLLTSFATTPVFDYDLKMLLAIIPCAVAGGLVGAVFNRKFSEKAIQRTFTVVVSAVTMLSLYNAINSFI